MKEFIVIEKGEYLLAKNKSKSQLIKDVYKLVKDTKSVLYSGRLLRRVIKAEMRQLEIYCIDYSQSNKIVFGDRVRGV